MLRGEDGFAMLSRCCKVGLSCVKLEKVLEHGLIKHSPSDMARVVPLQRNEALAAGARERHVDTSEMSPGVESVFWGLNLVRDSERGSNQNFGHVYSRYVAKGLNGE